MVITARPCWYVIIPQSSLVESISKFPFPSSEILLDGPCILKEPGCIFSPNNLLGIEITPIIALEAVGKYLAYVNVFSK